MLLEGMAYNFLEIDKSIRTTTRDAARQDNLAEIQDLITHHLSNGYSSTELVTVRKLLVQALQEVLFNHNHPTSIKFNHKKRKSESEPNPDHIKLSDAAHIAVKNLLETVAKADKNSPSPTTLLTKRTDAKRVSAQNIWNSVAHAPESHYAAKLKQAYKAILNKRIHPLSVVHTAKGHLTLDMAIEDLPIPKAHELHAYNCLIAAVNARKLPSKKYHRKQRKSSTKAEFEQYPTEILVEETINDQLPKKVILDLNGTGKKLKIRPVKRKPLQGQTPRSVYSTITR